MNKKGRPPKNKPTVVKTENKTDTITKEKVAAEKADKCKRCGSSYETGASRCPKCLAPTSWQA